MAETASIVAVAAVMLSLSRNPGATFLGLLVLELAVLAALWWDARTRRYLARVSLTGWLAQTIDDDIFTSFDARPPFDAPDCATCVVMRAYNGTPCTRHGGRGLPPLAGSPRRITFTVLGPRP